LGSERRAVIDPFRESQRWLIEQSIVGVCVTQDERYAFVNARFAQMCGLTPGEVTGLSVQALIFPDDREVVALVLREQLDGRRGAVNAAYRLLRKDGQVVHVEAHGSVCTFEGRPATIGVVLDVTERRAAEAEAREAARRHRGIFENAVEGIFQTREDGSFITVNPALARILGYQSPQELMETAPDLNHRIYVEPGRYHEFRRQIAAHDRVFEFESQVRRRDGSVIWISENARALREKSGALVGYEGTLVEITARKRAEERQRQSEERLALAARGANDALWDWDILMDSVYLSPRWAEMAGIPSGEPGPTPASSLLRVHEADREYLMTLVRAHLKGHSPHLEAEFRLLHGAGGVRWILLRGIAVRNEAGRAVRMAGSLTDITARKEAESKLRHDAFHDALTGLPNRALFMDRLEHALVRQKGRKQTCFSLLFIDLDRFKVVNDSLGHAMGDQLLIATARRLATCVRAVDTVARLGGDEFGVLLEDVQDGADARHVAERIVRELGTPLVLRGQEVFSAPSIGIAHGGPHYAHAEEVLRDADTAMYRAKDQGRKGFVEFDPSMHVRAVALLQLETDLRRSLERTLASDANGEPRPGELHLRYQPIIELSTGHICGVEALLRWEHPQRGLVGPYDFVPLAEETGLIVPIGAWALREACRQTSEWLRMLARKDALSVAVNFSPQQILQRDLRAQTARILSECGLPPQALRLEVTETVLMDNADRAAQVLVEMRELGVRVDLDDFGTGYSSLSYLHNLRLDALKIDRSFISRGGTEGGNWEIVRTIVSLARGLGIEVVAEGVETGEQLAAVRGLGVDRAQGFFFAKPLTARELSALLAGRATFAMPAVPGDAVPAPQPYSARASR
jgi:diguanylate cyclase (GGDEF)-like protein/PAS domain S-box-containing protein